MITRHESSIGRDDVWGRLAAEVPLDEIEWRQDGKPTQRDGKFFARFVAYIDAQFVRERLDLVVPGEWDLTLELLPRTAGDTATEDETFAFKARLQILGTIREDVGQGRDYKAAATDAFKRVAMRFGIGHELYSFGPNWVEVDGDGKYPKPVENPGDAYARRRARAGARTATTASKPVTKAEPKPEPKPEAKLPKGGPIAGAIAGAVNPLLEPSEEELDLLANDSHVMWSRAKGWEINGVALAEIEKASLSGIKLAAKKRGYPSLVRAVDDRLMTLAGV